MSNEGIDERTGKIDVYKLCPEQGDSIMIINCGTHYEVRHQHFEHAPIYLTEQDIEYLKQGRIVWN